MSINDTFASGALWNEYITIYDSLTMAIVFLFTVTRVRWDCVLCVYRVLLTNTRSSKWMPMTKVLHWIKERKKNSTQTIKMFLNKKWNKSFISLLLNKTQAEIHWSQTTEKKKEWISRTKCPQEMKRKTSGSFGSADRYRFFCVWIINSKH